MTKYPQKSRNATSSTQFTDAQDLKSLFFTNTESRRKKGDKVSGDSGY